VAQEYVPEIEEGEKRLLLLGASPIRAGKRVAIYRRRTVIGGSTVAPGERSLTRTRCEWGPAEARICELIRPKMLADGLYYASVDVVGDKVLEINVFTPGGMHSIEELYGIDVADLVVRDLERRVRLRAAYRTTFDPEAADMV
jgi:glutathione synthase